MYLHIIDDKITCYGIIPFQITLPDGMTRTSLNELSTMEQEALGLFEYQDGTPEYDPLLKQWLGEYTYSHEARTAIKTIVDRDAADIKNDKLAQLAEDQKVIQDAGLICSNEIKLQVGENDLIRWTQLMMNVMAFSPPTVQIRDYNNVTHTLQTSTEVVPMLAEVAAWGQAFLAETWRLKDEIING